MSRTAPHKKEEAGLSSSRSVSEGGKFGDAVVCA